MFFVGLTDKCIEMLWIFMQLASFEQKIFKFIIIFDFEHRNHESLGIVPLFLLPGTAVYFVLEAKVDEIVAKTR